MKIVKAIATGTFVVLGTLNQVFIVCVMTVSAHGGGTLLGVTILGSNIPGWPL